MDNLKSAAISVCSSLILFGIISLLTPEGALNKSLSRLLSVAFIAVTLSGISGLELQLDFNDKGDALAEKQSDVASDLSSTVMNQNLSCTELVLKQYISNELMKNGVADAEITVNADISDNYSICITDVDIVCKKGDAVICQSVLNQLNVTANITERE